MLFVISPRVLLATIAAGVIAVVAFSFLIPGATGVRAHPVDRRFKIYDVQYFPTTNYIDYIYSPWPHRLSYRLRRLMERMGVRRTTGQPEPPPNLMNRGPALLIYGRWPQELNTSPFILVKSDGEEVNPFKRFGPDFHRLEQNRFLWCYTLYDRRDNGVNYWLSNGTYRVRHKAEPNDLAVVRVQ